MGTVKRGAHGIRLLAVRVSVRLRVRVRVRVRGRAGFDPAEGHAPPLDPSIPANRRGGIGSAINHTRQEGPKALPKGNPELGSGLITLF